MGSLFISSIPFSAQQKNALRRELRQRRRALTKIERHARAQKLRNTLRTFEHFQASQHIAVYLTNDGEIDTSVFIRDLQQRGKTLYLPVLHPLKKGHLQFLLWNKNTPMRRNRYGISEPIFGRSRSIPPRFLQLVCMPLVAFDKQGNRLGMGGGFYDRTFAFMHAAGNKPVLLGCAYELQHVAVLPKEEWDIPTRAIATDQYLHRFNHTTPR